jgi:hypothetical protein
MSVEVETREAPALLEFKIVGGWPTVAEQQELRRQLSGRGQLSRHTRAMIDIRAADELPKFDEVDHAMVAAGQALDVLPSHIAFVVLPGAQFGIGRMLQSLSPPGLEVALFEDEALARDWLAQQ